MKKMHERTARLYEAVRSAGMLSGAADQSELAHLLNVSPQVVNNWEARGVSKDGALEAQSKIGVSATWVLEGKEPSFISGSRQAQDRPPLVRRYEMASAEKQALVDLLLRGESEPLPPWAPNFLQAQLLGLLEAVSDLMPEQERRKVG